VLTVAEVRAAELAAARKAATALMHEAHKDGTRAALNKYLQVRASIACVLFARDLPCSSAAPPLISICPLPPGRHLWH
jgi:hypothetical protein